MLHRSTLLIRRSIRYASFAILLLTIITPGGSELHAQQACCDSSGCDCRTDGCDSCCHTSACDGCGGFDVWGELCGGDCRCRERLFGDFCGYRSCYAEYGITADYRFTQFYQGVASGGRDQDFQYGGKFDSIYTLQGEKIGLNKGFMAMMHVESRYGQDANSESGSLAFPNANMLWPLPGEAETSISGLIMIQALSEKIALTAGKYNGMDLFNMLYPNQGRGIDGFMNLTFLLPPTLFRTTNLSFNGAGILGMRENKSNRRCWSTTLRILQPRSHRTYSIKGPWCLVSIDSSQSLGAWMGLRVSWPTIATAPTPRPIV